MTKEYGAEEQSREKPAGTTKRGAAEQCNE